MLIELDDPAALLAAIRKARQQCQVRVAQLSNCRVCGADLQSFEQTVEQLRRLERTLETSHVQPVPAQP